MLARKVFWKNRICWKSGFGHRIFLYDKDFWEKKFFYFFLIKNFFFECFLQIVIRFELLKLLKSDILWILMFKITKKNQVIKELNYTRWTKFSCFGWKNEFLKLNFPRGYAEKWSFWVSKTFFEKGVDKSDFLWYNIWALNERAKKQQRTSRD